MWTYNTVHKSRNCPAFHRTFKRCGNSGNFTVDCFANLRKVKKIETRQNADDSEKMYFVDSIKIKKGRCKEYKEVVLIGENKESKWAEIIIIDDTERNTSGLWAI